MTARRTRREFAASRSGPEIAFLLQDFSDAYNVGAMFRIADALGAKEIVISGNGPAPPDPRISVPSMGAHRRVQWRRIVSHEEAAESLRSEGYDLVAIELTTESIPYTDFNYPLRVCLVLGNEQKGVYEKVLRHCGASVHIPMAGQGRSLNVSVAGAIAGFSVRDSGTPSDTRDTPAE